ncbi:RipA family octameric membrane protein, partial [Acinetobacter stercoris]
MIFQGVLFACLIYSSNTVPYVQLILCLVGFYVAYSQTAVAAGAKYWQEFWEKKLEDIEITLFDFYKNQDNNNDKKIAVDDNSTEFYQLFSTPKDKIHENVIAQLNKNIEADSFIEKINTKVD